MQANAAGAEQTASASEELTAQSIELRAGVDVLVRLVNGQSFAEIQEKDSFKTSEPRRKSGSPPVKPLDLPRRKPYSVAAGSKNGHRHNGTNHDDFFADM
jgi:hypothetical protein